MRTTQEQEFRQFAAECLPWLTRTATALAGDAHRGDDLVQDTLVKAYVHWRRVQGADNPRAYLRRILVRCSMDVARSPRSRREVTVGDPAEGPARAQASVEDGSSGLVQRDELCTALTRLGLRQRQVLVLRFIEDLDVATTASLLNISEGTVKSTTSQALVALRRVLAETDHQEVSR